MNKSLLRKPEDQIFNLVYQALAEKKINYICDLGIRFFYPTGYSYGLCTNTIWQDQKQKSDINVLISMFYAQELLRLKRNHYNHAIRVQGQVHHQFLKEISDKGLGNVLVIYIFKPNKIIGFYFLVQGDDVDAVNRFHNDKSIFERVVKDSFYKVENIEKEYNLNHLSTPFFSKQILTDSGDKIILTTKQSDIFKHIAHGNKHSKEIASLSGITPKQVDKHISALKSKFCVNGRNQLVDIANNYKNRGACAL